MSERQTSRTQWVVCLGIAALIIGIISFSGTAKQREFVFTDGAESPGTKYWDWEFHKSTEFTLEFRPANPRIPLEEISKLYVLTIEVQNQKNRTAAARHVVRMKAGRTPILEVSKNNLRGGDVLSFTTVCECLRTGLLGSSAYSSFWDSEITLQESDFGLWD